jgi:hypothetical protein
MVCSASWYYGLIIEMIKNLNNLFNIKKKTNLNYNCVLK